MVLGETGIGKNSFIHAISKTNKSEVGNEGKACTKDYDNIVVKNNIENFSFFDTPGLNDAKGDRQY